MSDHDPLCPHGGSPLHWTESNLCECALIAEAARREREKTNGNEAYNAGYHDGVADERERIAAAIEAIPRHGPASADLRDKCARIARQGGK